MTAGLRFESAARSEVGNVRKLNEDAFLDHAARGLWVVADGMGGHAAGDVASRRVVDGLRGVAAHDSLGRFVDDVEDRVLGANAELHALATGGEEQRIVGCTVAALLAMGRYCVSVWAGDSRVYRLRAGKLEQITRDHSEVEELLERGEISADSAHAQAVQNIITRAVGGGEQLFLDYALHGLRAADRYLVCSDGLYKELSSEELEERLARGSCAAACGELLDTALSRECADNVTAVVVDFLETPQ